MELVQRKKEHVTVRDLRLKIEAFESFKKLSKAPSQINSRVVSFWKLIQSFRMLWDGVPFGKAPFESWSRAFKSSATKLVNPFWIQSLCQIELWLYFWPEFWVFSCFSSGYKYVILCDQLYLVVNRLVLNKIFSLLPRRRPKT